MSDVAEKEELEIIEQEDDSQEVAEQQEEKAEVEAEAEQEAPKNDNEDELAQYSESVQRRIRTLTGKYREEERQRQAAIEYAEAVKKQNEELKAKLDNLDKSYQGEFGSRVESQIESAKQAYQKAYDDGDAEAMFEAQKNLSKLALDQARLEESNLSAKRQQKLLQHSRNNHKDSRSHNNKPRRTPKQRLGQLKMSGLGRIRP